MVWNQSSPILVTFITERTNAIVIVSGEINIVVQEAKSQETCEAITQDVIFSYKDDEQKFKRGSHPLRASRNLPRRDCTESK